MSHRAAWLSAVLLLVIGLACGGPIGPIPGGALRGPVVPEPVADWSFLPASGRFALETRPEDPYSVLVGFTQRGGRLYVDPGRARRWYGHLVEDPRVRLRVEGRIYRARAVEVTDPLERAGFAPDRTVYRLEPR